MRSQQRTCYAAVSGVFRKALNAAAADFPARKNLSKAVDRGLQEQLHDDRLRSCFRLLLLSQ